MGILFVALAFLTPLVSMVSGSSTCEALVIVGYLMMTSINEIDWKRLEHAFPAFVIIMGIPFTYSITNGIGLGFLSYIVIMVATGRVREIRPLMWIASAAFLIMFVLG